MNSQLLKKVQKDLGTNEEIIWSDKPDPNKHFNSGDIFLVPFTLLWFGFAVFWETSVLLMVPKNEPVGIFFPVFGSFFVVMGFYIAIGRFFYKFYRNKSTLFILTNKRVLIASNFPKYLLKSQFLKDLKVINKSGESKEVGTITFGENHTMTAIYQNSGMEFFGNAYGNTSFSFFNIKNAQNVYDQIIQLKN